MTMLNMFSILHCLFVFLLGSNCFFSRPLDRFHNYMHIITKVVKITHEITVVTVRDKYS